MKPESVFHAPVGVILGFQIVGMVNLISEVISKVDVQVFERSGGGGVLKSETGLAKKLRFLELGLRGMVGKCVLWGFAFVLRHFLGKYDADTGFGAGLKFGAFF